MEDMPSFQRTIYALMVGLVGLVGILLGIIIKYTNKQIDGKVGKEGFEQWKFSVDKAMSAKLDATPYYSNIMEAIRDLKDKCKDCEIRKKYELWLDNLLRNKGERDD